LTSISARYARNASEKYRRGLQGQCIPNVLQRIVSHVMR